MADHIELSEELHWASQRDVQSRFKLFNNLDRVLRWVATGQAFPILVNMTLTNQCNHRCPLCTSREYLDDRTMSATDAKRVISELAELGAKAIGFGGGGDPTCHPNLAEIICYSAERGLEVSLTTNGQLLNSDIIEASIRHCTWIRVSLDADSPATYKKTHGMDANAYARVIENIAALVAEKRRTGSKVTLGNTYLVGPHTLSGAFQATAKVRELGMDYMRLRPFFEWDQNVAEPGSSEPDSFGRIRPSRAYSAKQAFQDEMIIELARCESLTNDSFLASYPKDRALAPGEHPTRLHKLCYIHHFQIVISADLNVYPCCMLEDNSKYSMGSLRNQSVSDLWYSDGRQQAYGRIDFSDCPNPCMLEKHNELLWTIKHNEIGHQNVSEMLAATRTHHSHGNFL